MTGKPYPFFRQCFQCGHSHANNVTCDEARQLRTAGWIVDFGAAIGGALIIFACVMGARELGWL